MRGLKGKEGIRCNVLAPGLVLSEQLVRNFDEGQPAHALDAGRSPRLGDPADLAGAAAFLFSDDAAWINGQAWSIDGGVSLRA